MPFFWKPFEFECADKSFRRQDLVIHTMKRILVARLIFVNISIRAAGYWFKSLQGHFEFAWPKPPDIKFRISMCLKHQLSRCVKLTRNEDLLFTGFCRNSCFVCHNIYSWWIVAKYSS